MRFYEIKKSLNEYADLEKEKEQIITTISGMKASDEQEAQILDRIWRLLNSEQVQDAINKGFLSSIDDESFSAKEKQNIMRDLQDMMVTVTSDYKTIQAFLDKLEGNGAVNIKALSQPISTFEQVFSGDRVAIELFQKMKSYGSGKNQKGPGEYALAILSPKIALRSGGGDIDIQGIGQVELKAAAGTSGGRLGHGGLPQKDAKNILQKYHDNVPALKQHFEQGAKGMGLGQFVQYLNQELPPTSPENTNLRQQIALDLYSPVFGEFANAIADAFKNTDAKKIETEIVKANYNHYLDKDYFDVLMLCSFAAEKFATIRSADDIINLRNQGKYL